RQQAEAVGWLGSAHAIAGVLAFVIVGFVAMINWRLAFGLLPIHAAAILFLSTRLRPDAGRPEVKVDVLGVILSAVGIISLAFGVNTLRNWGVLVAKPAAPFDLLGLSPAPVLMAAGVTIVGAFFVWSHRRTARSRTPLIALEVLDSPGEWAA